MGTKIEKLDDYEVVYKPTTTISTTATTTTTTTTHDPIADHVNLLLQQYFSTQTPDSESSGVPMITYDDENNSIVMEYLSPDGEQAKIEPETSTSLIPEVEQPVQIPSFFPQPENP